MKKNLPLLVLFACGCMLLTSCNVNVFSHSYTTGSAENAYVDTNPLAPGLSEGEVEEDGPDFWTLILGKSSWQGLFNVPIFNSSEPAGDDN